VKQKLAQTQYPLHDFIRRRYDRLFSCLLPGNQLWAGQAPVLMLSVARLVFEEDQSPNRHALHDVGLAVENLIVQAMALGCVCASDGWI
jgi:hypothetical protein